MKFDIKGYYEPTPEKIRKFGDFLLWISQIIGSNEILMNNKEVGLVLIVAGTIGKGISNFFVEYDKH
jgi:hypothetical protein